MIDAYEVLGLGLDANEDDVKKAFRRKSLQYHPDKVQASGAPSDAREVNARFNEIQEARDILSNADRKQMYDTFGVDIGDKSPEIEVWSIGFENLLSPMGMLTLQTAGLRLCLWLAVGTSGGPALGRACWRDRSHRPRSGAGVGQGSDSVPGADRRGRARASGTAPSPARSARALSAPGGAPEAS